MGDDLANSGRTNGDGVDLNRDFLRLKAPETKAVVDWILNNPFVLSANFHGGALVANYPYDHREGPSPDKELFRLLSSTYASNHPEMSLGKARCYGDRAFPGGITNGAEWVKVSGTMQDFNYLYSDCLEITVELGCCKYPSATSLEEEWGDNKESLLAFLEASHLGVKGMITDGHGRTVGRGVRVVVEGVDKPVHTSERGEYWRLLVPGRYWLRAEDAKARTQSAWRRVTVAPTRRGTAQRVDLRLSEPLANGCALTSACTLLLLLSLTLKAMN
jgi:carboxypeptidase D